MKINDRNFITVQGWMINELHLKGTELIVYAVIYGFSQAEGQRYTGSLQYLAEWCNTTKRSVQTALKGLLEKGYILKEDKYINGVKFVEYFVGIEKFSMGGIEKFSTNNIDIDNIDISNYKGTAKNFVKPTIEEIKAYCQERNNHVDPEKFLNYYTANGWKVGKNPMKDWRACIRSWEKNQFSTGRKNQSVPDYMTDNYETDNAPASLDETRKMLERMKHE